VEMEEVMSPARPFAGTEFAVIHHGWWPDK
jgi:hypothetical protein